MRLAWSALTLVRIVALATLALAPPVFVIGGHGSSRFLGALAVATLVATLTADRFAWSLALRSLVEPPMRGRFVAGTLSYVAYTAPWAILVALITLMVGGLWPLTFGETAPAGDGDHHADAARPEGGDRAEALVHEVPRTSGPAHSARVTDRGSCLLPAPARPTPASAEPEGYTVYRPSTLDD